MKVAAVLLCLMLSFPVFAQDIQGRLHYEPLSNTSAFWDEEEEEEEDMEKYKGFGIGISLGGYFASKSTANIYNGSNLLGSLGRADGVDQLTIGERLDPNLFIFDVQRILNEFNATGVEVPFDSSPINMRYSPAFGVGVQLKYNFDRYRGLIFNMNALRLRTIDVFTLRFVGTGQQFNAQQDVRTFDIVGSEQRFEINLGYRQGFLINEMSNFYLQFGGNMLGVQMQQNQIRVGENTFDLIIGAQNPQQILTLDNAPTGIGFGAYGAMGMEFFIKDKYGFDIGFQFSNDQMRYFEYAQRGWNYWLMATFSL